MKIISRFNTKTTKTYSQSRCCQQTPSEELQKYDDDGMINTGGTKALRLEREEPETSTTVKKLTSIITHPLKLHFGFDTEMT